MLARHGSERVSQSMAVQTGLVVTDILVKGESENKNLLMGALGVGAQVGILLPYGRTQESEADVIGQELMARAGFDPAEAVLLWENMQMESTGGPPEILSTHPSHQSRISKLKEGIPKFGSIYESSRKSQCRF